MLRLVPSGWAPLGFAGRGDLLAFRQDAIPLILGRRLTGNVLAWHLRQRRIC